MTGSSRGPAQSTRGRPSDARSPAIRPHFTGRAAVLAIVLCAIALSLAYPVREYISQRRQIDQLEAQSSRISQRRQRLEAENRLLHSRAYIAEQARDRLHMCLPTQVCYLIIGQAAKPRNQAARHVAVSWYAKIWSSVQQANQAPATTADGVPAANRPAGGHGAHRARSG